MRTHSLSLSLPTWHLSIPAAPLSLPLSSSLSVLRILLSLSVRTATSASAASLLSRRGAASISIAHFPANANRTGRGGTPGNSRCVASCSPGRVSGCPEENGSVARLPSRRADGISRSGRIDAGFLLNRPGGGRRILIKRRKIHRYLSAAPL